MNKDESQLIVITDDEKKVTGVGGLTAFLGELEKQVKKTDSMEIVDENSMIIMDNTVKQAKKLKGQIDKKKLSITEEWRSNTKSINEISKRMTDKIQKVIDSGGAKVVAWKLEEENKQKAALKAAEEKQAKLDKINTQILTIMDEFNAEIAEVETEEELSALSLNYVSKKNTESWHNVWTKEAEGHPDLQDKITGIRTSMLAIGKATRQKLDAIKSGDKKAAKEIEKQTSELADHESQKIIADSISSDNTEMVNTAAEVSTLSKKKVSGIRKTWKYRIVDSEKVPKGLMSPDDKKIKAFMEKNKDPMIKEELNTPGIEFYQEATHVS